MSLEATLIITLGERKRWLSKPADYASLLECARRRFNELEGLQDGDIIFCFTPEWFGEELELDESTFQYVHDKAKLRIDTRRPAGGLARPKRSTGALEAGEEGQASPTNPTKPEPCRKRIKAEHAPIDLTLSPPSTSSPLPSAATPGPGPELNRPRIQSQLDRERDVRSEEPQRQPSDTSALTSDNFSVEVASPARALCPTRRQAPDEWVGCNKPWANDKDNKQFNVRVFTGKPLANAPQNHTMRLTFRSKHVRIRTLFRHVHERGYPNPKPEFRHANGCRLPYCFSTFAFNDVQSHSDVYVINNRRPGVYLLPPAAPDEAAASDDGIELDKSVVAMPRVHVSLSLAPEIRFASLYPWTKVEADGQREKVEWGFRVSNTGDSVFQVGQETYYGHPSWELAINGSAAHSPTSSDRTTRSSLFRRLLNPETAAVLSRVNTFPLSNSTVPHYLQKVLEEQLRLPLGIAEDFMHYLHRYLARLPPNRAGDRWHVALAFVPQETLEEMAPLAIAPKPAATARVFLLWGAVNTWRRSGPWAAWFGRRLTSLAAQRSKNWADIIGLGRVAWADGKEFRAIEWGVMQVPEEYLVGET